MAIFRGNRCVYTTRPVIARLATFVSETVITSLCQNIEKKKKSTTSLLDINSSLERSVRTLLYLYARGGTILLFLLLISVYFCKRLALGLFEYVSKQFFS